MKGVSRSLRMARMRHACKAEGVLLGLVGEVRSDIDGAGPARRQTRSGKKAGRRRHSVSGCIGGG